MEGLLITAINMFADVLITMLFIRAIMSWFVPGMGSSAGRVYRFFVEMTEPFVQPCRRLLSHLNTGMFDWSVLLAFFLIRIAANILIMLIRVIL
jgi:YggT family protein